MSRVLPNAMVAQAFYKLGIRNEFLEADLPPMVDLGLQKLYGFQHNDGGWGWWYDDSTDVNQTAYVLLGLVATGQAGFDVDDGVMEHGFEALRLMLPGADPRAQAYGAWVLTVAGQPVSVTLTLSDVVALDLFSQAALAITFDASGSETMTVALLDNLREAAIQDDTTAHWEGGDVVYSRKVMGSTVRTTAMVAHALARLDPESPLLSKAVRWLMGQRQGQGWGDTQKTSFAILAITDYLLLSQQQAAGSAYQVYVNGELWQEGTLDQVEADQTLVLTYSVAPAADEPLVVSETPIPGETITASETITAGEAVTTSEPITASEAVTTTGVITASEAITGGEAITTSGLITASEAITTSESITTGEAITTSEGITTSEPLTVSEALTVSESVSPSLLQPGENLIEIVLVPQGDRPAGQLYYATTVSVHRRPREGVIPALEAHERSIAIRREYRMQGSKELATQFQRGDLVEVHLTLEVPEESWYVVIDDPLPAGFEALNERLGTTSHAAAAYGEPVYFWERYGYNRKDVRDERVTFFVTHLLPGQRIYSYLVRVTTAGDFGVLPTQVYPMYEPAVWSRSESTRCWVEIR